MIDNSNVLDKYGISEVDENEQGLLLDTTDVTSAESDQSTFFVGIDCGSTQTRVVVVPYETVNSVDDIGSWFDIGAVIPSVSKPIPLNKGIRYKTHKLVDMMDSVFSFNGGQPYRVVRGSKALEYEVVQYELIASERKVDSEALRVNIADAIGYAFVQHSAKTGIPMPKTVYVHLSVALPPDDVRMHSALEQIKSDLKVVNWEWCGKESIVVKITSFKVMSEPEAQAKAYYVLKGEEFPEELVMLEVGGRNGATSILINGGPIEQASKPIDQSGSKLLDKIGDEYIAQFSGKMPSSRHLMSAVRTGKMKYGNEYRDIVNIITRCKDDVAEDLFYKLQSNVISRQTVVSMESINMILLGGRVFDPGDYNYSVARKFKELLKQVSPGTLCEVVRTNLIPQGLVISDISDSWE
jgi:hypothetical protein